MKIQGIAPHLLEYTNTQARGFTTAGFYGKNTALLQDVLSVLDANADYLPLTLRQVFYQLVATRGYPKHDPPSPKYPKGNPDGPYTRLLNMVVNGRRSGRIPWDAIRDDTATAIRTGYQDGEFWKQVRARADEYARAINLPLNVELWVESGGMAHQVVAVAREFGVPVYSGGGFDSVTLKYDAARRYVDRDFPTLVLHVGDWDWHGVTIVHSAYEDIATMCSQLGSPGIVTFEHLLVTQEQVATYDLPHEAADSKRPDLFPYTVQAEALAPATLAQIIRDALTDALDPDALALARAQAETDKAAVVAVLDEVAPVDDDEATDEGE
jgi:hypothetical protein